MNTFIKSGKIKGSLVTLLKKILLVLSKQQKINWFVICKKRFILSIP